MSMLFDRSAMCIMLLVGAFTMEREEVDRALEQLHRALAVVRNLLIESGDVELGSSLLDKIEVLPQLIQQFSEPRAQQHFRSVIEELQSSHPYFAILETSDESVPMAR